MSLSGTLNIASNALFANQIGLQVTGQNIANANTPGYVREQVVQRPAPTQRLGQLVLGLGVEVVGMQQKIDTFLETRLRGASSDVAASEAQVDAYNQLEALIGELNDTDLSTSLNNFFNSIHDVLTDPASDSVRNLVVLRGETLAADIRRLSQRATEIRESFNDRIEGAAVDINRYVQEVATLNVRIAESESSSANASDAVGLRDRRAIALDALANLIDIDVTEEPNGAVNVLHQGEFLVSAGQSRSVEVAYDPEQGTSAAYLQLADTQTQLAPTSGQIAGFTTARDDILGAYLDQLDGLAGALAFEFNRLHTSGQGLRGYTSLTSAVAVTDPNLELDAAGLDNAPTNGGFDLQVFDRRTGLTRTSRITVNLDGLGSDTTLTSFAAAIDAVDGVSARVLSTGRLEIESDSSTQEVAFANDSSGALAALGLNTFFTGSTAGDLDLNQELIDDPRKFAASQNGVGEDSENAVALGDFLDRPLESQDNSTLSSLYDRMVNGVTEGAAVAKSVADGFSVFQKTLIGQKSAVSGVSIDEEAVRLIEYQRAFQANARVISTINDLFNILVNL